MQIKEAQTAVDKWIKEFGINYFPPVTNLGILLEEMGEMARYIVRIYGEQSFKHSDQEPKAHSKLSEEMGDVLFVLLCLANQTGVDLTKELQKNLKRKSKRDAERHRRNKKITPPGQEQKK